MGKKGAQHFMQRAIKYAVHALFAPCHAERDFVRNRQGIAKLN